MVAASAMTAQLRLRAASHASSDCIFEFFDVLSEFPHIGLDIQRTCLSSSS